MVVPDYLFVASRLADSLLLRITDKSVSNNTTTASTIQAKQQQQDLKRKADEMDVTSMEDESAKKKRKLDDGSALKLESTEGT